MTIVYLQYYVHTYHKSKEGTYVYVRICTYIIMPPVEWSVYVNNDSGEHDLEYPLYVLWVCVCVRKCVGLSVGCWCVCVLELCMCVFVGVWVVGVCREGRRGCICAYYVCVWVCVCMCVCVCTVPLLSQCQGMFIYKYILYITCCLYTHTDVYTSTLHMYIVPYACIVSTIYIVSYVCRC